MGKQRWDTFRKIGAVGTIWGYLFTHVLFGYRPAIAAESQRGDRGFWMERRRASASHPLPHGSTSTSSLQRLLPAGGSACSPFPPNHSALSPRLAGLPGWAKKIPFRLCTLSEVRRTSKEAGWIVLLQDLHGHEETQRNIAGILEALSGEHLTVGLEGASGPFDFSDLRDSAHPDAVRAAADHFLTKAWIGGAQYLGLTGNAPPRFVGVEDLPLYEAHIRAYLDTRPLLPVVEQNLKLRESSLQREKETLLSPDLLALDRARTLFCSNGSPFQYLAALQSLGSGLPAGPNLERVFHASASLKKGGDIRSLEREMGGVDRFALLEELNDYEKRVASSLFRSSEEKDVWEASDALSLTVQMVHQRLTPAGWGRYAAAYKKTLSDLPAPFERFYRLAQARDGAMARAIRSAVPSPKTGGKDRLCAALVAGGFHTAGLVETFSSAGFNVMVLAPKTTKLPQEQSLAVFTRERSPLDRILLGERTFLGNPLGIGNASGVPQNYQTLSKRRGDYFRILRDALASKRRAFGRALSRGGRLLFIFGSDQKPPEPYREIDSGLGWRTYGQPVSAETLTNYLRKTKWAIGTFLLLLTAPAIGAVPGMEGIAFFSYFTFSLPTLLLIQWMERWRSNFFSGEMIDAAPSGGSRVVLGKAVMWTEDALVRRARKSRDAPALNFAKAAYLFGFRPEDVDWTQMWTRLDDLKKLVALHSDLPKWANILRKLSSFYVTHGFPQREGKQAVLHALNRLMVDPHLKDWIPIEKDLLGPEARIVVEKAEEANFIANTPHYRFILNRNLLLLYFGNALIPGSVEILLFDGVLNANNFHLLRKLYPNAYGFVSTQDSPNNHSILGISNGDSKIVVLTNAKELKDRWSTRPQEIHRVVMDEAGKIIVNPSHAQEVAAQKSALEDRALEKMDLTPRSTERRSLSRVNVMVNADNGHAVSDSLQGGGTGVGLVRSEDVFRFLKFFPIDDYLSITEDPTIEIRMNEALTPLLSLANEKKFPIHVRLIDFQDDKFKNYIGNVKERGLDFLLHNPLGRRLAKIELVVLARWAADNPALQLSVLFPEVRTEKDAVEIRKLFVEVSEENPLLSETLKNLPVRFMVESPVQAQELLNMVAAGKPVGISFGSNSWLEDFYQVKRGTEESLEFETGLDLPLLADIDRLLDLVGRINEESKGGQEITFEICGNFAARDEALALLPGLAARHPGVRLTISVPPGRVSISNRLLRQVDRSLSLDLLESILRVSLRYMAFDPRRRERVDVNFLLPQTHPDSNRQKFLRQYAQRRVEIFLEWVRLKNKSTPEYQRTLSAMEKAQSASKVNQHPLSLGAFPFLDLGATADFGGGWTRWWEAMTTVAPPVVWGAAAAVGLGFVVWKWWRGHPRANGGGTKRFGIENRLDAFRAVDRSS